MNQELKSVSFASGGHPDEDQLLLTLERELPREDAACVEQHLGSCWSCRARYDEMQRGILAFVEYREKRYLPFVGDPPDDSIGFRDRLRNVVLVNSSVGFTTRIWRSLVHYITLRRQVGWVSAVAAAMAAVILWIHVLVAPGVVSANELLVRAVAAQNPSSPDTGAHRRVVHQKMQIRSGGQAVVRDFEWTVGRPGTEGRPMEYARWELRPDVLEWNAPMTAAGFAGWRDSLPEKKDTVKRERGLLTLDTATDQSFIKDAWIVLRAADFHPVEQHLRFADDRQLDFIELAFRIDDEPQQADRPALEQPIATLTPPKSPTPDTVSAAPNLDDAEMQLRYALFANHWDLDEDLVLGRNAGQVVLSGIVGSQDRADAMRATLSALPNVRFAVDLPPSDSRGATPVQTVPAEGRVPLLKNILESRFASRDARLEFEDRCLADSDAALSHAWALKRLVDRYSESEERLLTPESDQKLRAMLRAHLRELGRINGGLTPFLDLLPPADAALPASPTDWRRRILDLFSAVQQQDRLVSGLVAGSLTDGQNLATASANFRTAHKTIDMLLGNLKELDSDSAVK